MSRNSVSFSLLAISASLLLTLHSVSAATASSYMIDSNPPSAPSYPTAVVNSNKVVLTWVPANDDVGIKGYSIYKNGTFLTSPSGAGTTYVDTDVVSGQTYTYAIQAQDKGGNMSSQSQTISITALDGSTSQVVTSSSPINTAEIPPVTLPQASVYSSASYNDQAPVVVAPVAISLVSVGNQLHVKWKNPEGNTFKSVRVIRKANNFPVSTTDGKIICDGIMEVCIDKDVVAGQGYYYGVYAVDQSYLTSKLVLVSGALVENKEVVSPQKTTTATTVVQPTSLPPSSVATSQGGSDLFTRTLKVGSVGKDVMALQKFLNSAGFPVTLSGAGSAGNETETFGNATQRAVQAYQCSKKIVCEGTPASTGYGLVGKTTRGYLNKENN